MRFCWAPEPKPNAKNATRARPANILCGMGSPLVPITYFRSLKPAHARWERAGLGHPSWAYSMLLGSLWALLGRLCDLLGPFCQAQKIGFCSNSVNEGARVSKISAMELECKCFLQALYVF